MLRADVARVLREAHQQRIEVAAVQKSKTPLWSLQHHTRRKEHDVELSAASEYIAARHGPLVRR
ncbi:hypothetical protein ALI22I_23240 [Saccharothrix sp. ALI-22-I]|uniref:hypothetical protein n=1 Tax=Saccharothrix sp. ALI-22-I TaxID=1933778 RepID=UPI0009D07112|nr:hypothetical protein [Saccharothrix sp. ALI-22-I]ONI87339.1 hypothetical protein ALI22I_23240 [Saccharothrix sp. ALI-22-I]